jgi:hypothetical protein
MSVLLKASMALGFIVTIPLLAVPARGAPAPETVQKPVHYQSANFAKAQALVIPATHLSGARETNGLGRNDEECNMGCIDH